MIALKRILLPTHFSPFSQPPVEFACQLVDNFEAELHVLHVATNMSDLLPDFGMGVDLQPLREAWTTGREQRELDTLGSLSDVLGLRLEARKAHYYCHQSASRS